MRATSAAVLLAVLLATPLGASPVPDAEVGSLVGVSVEMGGRESPLYPAPDGSGRFYLEARPGACYTLRLANRSPERLGVAVVVDGLDAITGERNRLAPDGRPGRLYVLDPWDRMVVRGWRSSLEAVHRFTFVGEKASYAARAGKANGKMGWIQLAVYRERRPPRTSGSWIGGRDEAAGADRGADEPEAARRQEEAPPATTLPPHAGATDRAAEAYEGAREKAQSYPGTGWGPRTRDRVVVVDFQPEPVPTERVDLRYEYRNALYALGVLPWQPPRNDRLHQRDAGRDGFAKPPDW
jgi:hypothetical protein